MSSSNNELKPLISALLAFGTIMVIKQDFFAASLGSTEKQETVVVFIALLVVQVLFEILYKYEGKTCEITEGIFTALSGVIGFYIAGMIAEKSAMARGDTTVPPNIIGGALGAALGLWIWKRFLKGLILPSSCSPGGTLSCPPCAPVIVSAPPAPATPTTVAAEKFGVWRRY